jgi:hypothetical protein
MKWSRRALLTPLLIVVIANLATSAALARKRAQQRTTGEGHAMVVSPSGITTVSSGRGPLGRALVTIQTEELKDSCARACPSSRFWIVGRGEVPPAEEASIVQELTISVDRRNVNVPSLAYLGMYEVTWATVEQQGHSFVLTVAGADGAERYTTRIYFSANGVERMTDEYGGCGIKAIGDRTEFSYRQRRPKKIPVNPSSGGREQVWRRVDAPGKATLRIHTARGDSTARIVVAKLGTGCAGRCPDAGAVPDRHSSGPIFVQDIVLTVGNKRVYGLNSGIRNMDALWGVTGGPISASLGGGKGEFVLWIRAGYGRTASLREIRFNSDSIVEIKEWQISKGMVADTHFYPSECE